MTVATMIDVQATPVEIDGFDYDAMISDPENREWAESAAGFINYGLGKAVVKVLEAGNLLSEAKHRLPHGEYMAWVDGALPFNVHHAARLIKASEWVSNLGQVPTLESVADTRVLFLLSADTTPEDVREWFMERAAAGDPPSRAEVAERKRRAAGKPPAPRPVEIQALTLYRKAQTQEMDAALTLARQITTVSEAEMLQEVGLREAPKVKVIPALSADFHRRPDGSGWDRIPHAGRIDAPPAPPAAAPRQQMEIAMDPPAQPEAALDDLSPWEPIGDEVVRVAEAAARMQLPSQKTLSDMLGPKRIARFGLPVRNGWQAEPYPRRGYCTVRRVA